jgi:hypothetical protein
MGKNIMDLAKHDYMMGVRVASINDLMAAEGKYHLPCLNKVHKGLKIE